MVSSVRALWRLAIFLAAAFISGPLAVRGDGLGEDPANPRAFARDGESAEARGRGSPRPFILSPTYIFRGPADPETIRQRLSRPDLVILGLDEYERLVETSGAQLAPPRPPEAIIEAVRIAGLVEGGLADLSIICTIHIPGSDPVWIPIRLDGLTVTSAMEADRDLPLRVAGEPGPANGWAVQLQGQGVHEVEFRVLIPVRTDAGLRSLDLAIPPALSTRLQLDVPPGAVDAQAGLDEPLTITRTLGPSGPLDRIRSDGLRPRDRLSIQWRSDSGPDAIILPMLTARGDIALEVNRGVLLTQSTWSIQCIRGAARTIELRLDDRGDELLTAELDERPIPVGESFDPRTGLLTIELPEPLRAEDEARRLTLTTRRSLPTGIAARFAYRGFRLDQAIEQSGVVAVVQGEDLWVNAVAGRGLRQINPLTDLTESLRTRPKVVLAFRFIEQPFDLQIRSDPAPPQSRVAIRSTIAVDATLARIESELEYVVSRGRLQEIRLGIPEGLELRSVGPASVVESSHVVDEETVDAESPSGRTLLVRLTERARSSGASFRVRISGRQELVPSSTARIGLFRPETGSLQDHRLAVLAPPTIAVESRDAGRNGPFRTVGAPGAEETADWPRLVEPASESLSPELWLWTDVNARHLNVELASRSLDLHHETQVLAEIDLRRSDLRQETTCHVREGVLREVEVAVPPELEGRWELDGDEVATRERLGSEPDGGIRYRLVLSRRAIDLVRLRFLARLPIDPALSVGNATILEIPWIRILSGSASPTRVSVAADPGIRLATRGAAWGIAPSAAPGQDAISTLPVRFEWSGSPSDGGFPSLEATAPMPAELPSTLVSRLWLRSFEGPDGRRQDTAWYRVESHKGSFLVALPQGAELTRAQVGHDAVEPNRLEEGLRLRLPTEFSGTILVRLDYRVTPVRGRSAWQPPRLLAGGLVQEALWEVNIPWNRAVVGTPSGWVNENQWYWGGYVWKRRPAQTTEELAAWVGGPSVRGRVEAAEAGTNWGGYHAYMFGTSGDPIVMRPTIFSRALLVAVFSGLALALGFLTLIHSPASRIAVLAALASLGAASASLWPDITLLVLQSASAGFFLTAIAAATKRYVDRRRTSLPVFGDSSQSSELLAEPSSREGRGSSRQVGVPELGSDDSTVIRRRPATTIDYMPTIPRESGASE